jgi:hypothetical protein
MNYCYHQYLKSKNMPNQDRTGPEGQGSRTGRGLGKCNPDNEDSNQSKGKGLGRGQGRGFGRRQGKGSGRGLGRGRNN